MLFCERSDEYKLSKKKLNREDTESKKCGCLFKLSDYVKKETNEWWLSILNEVHNHKMEKRLEGHLLVGQLIEKEKKVVDCLTKSLVQLKHISMNLKNEGKDNLKNIKQVYNALEKFKKSIRAEKSEMQHLFTCLEKHKYVYNCRSKCESTIVHDIF